MSSGRVGHLRRWSSALGVVAAVAAGVAVETTPAYAAAASMSIQKVASTTNVQPGDTFVYSIQVQCTTATAAGCVDATVTDPLPAYIELDGQPAINPPAATDLDTGPPLSIEFQEPLGDGTTGLPAGRVYTITIPVIVDPTIPPDQDGVDIDNTATITADNADPRASTATVTPSVPTIYAANTTKAYSPDSAIAGDTGPVTMTLTGQNTSNVPVDSLTIVDPGDPPVPPTAPLAGPFDYLELSGPTPFHVALPANATTVQVDVYDSSTGAWVPGTPSAGPDVGIPATVAAADITGLRFTFSPDVQPGETATVDVDFVQKPDNATTVPADGVTVDNTARASVTDGGTTTDGNVAGDDFSLRQSAVDVDAFKTIDPGIVHTGDPVDVTIGATNTSPDPVQTMTISEPGGVAPNPFLLGLEFGAIGSVTWPTGADQVTVTYSCGDPSTPVAPQTSTDPAVFPGPNCPAGQADVTGFSAEFADTDGSGIAAGATATIRFTATPLQPDDGAPVDELPYLNEIRADATNALGNSATDYANDTFRAIRDRLAVDVAKSIVPGTVPLYPGQLAIVALTGQVLPFPQSTVDADEIVVQDPQTLPEPAPAPPGFYDVFQPKGVSSTPVPACATLTVEYTTDTDGATWQPIPGMTFTGPTTVNAAFPDDVVADATGVRFVFRPAAGCPGLPPGTTVNPNIAFGIDPTFTSADPVTITNCAGSSASAFPPSLAPDAAAGPACDTIDIVPGQGAGTLDPIDKAWDVPSVSERSQQQAGLTIGWGTAGYSGLDHLTISDTADPSAGGLAGSVFDAFDLVRIDPIGESLDALMKFDQITAVELYSRSQDRWIDAGDTTVWADAAGDPCPSACDGTFPGYTLSTAQRADVLAFRLTYAESPTRAATLVTNPIGPPVGTGVAPAPDNARLVHPVFQLRDAYRSDATRAVVASETYNVAGQPGVVDNTARAAGYFDPDGPEVGHWDVDAEIVILPEPIVVDASKTWTGGPLGVPDQDTPPDLWPTSQVTLTGTNRAATKLDTLSISDDTDSEPPISADDPFDWFDVIKFDAITEPSVIGATGVTITLTGATPSTYTSIAGVLALTEAQLADVTHIDVTYTGRINVGDPAGNLANATATVVYDVRLRTASRAGGTPTTPAAARTPVNNEVTVTGTDLDDYGNVGPKQATDSANADMPLVQQGLTVEATKTISPDTITEPDDGPAAVTIGGQPEGPSRTVQMVLTDTDPRLWNQYDFTDFGPFTFTAPIDRVQVDAYTGGTWSLAAGQPVLTGGSWEIGTEATTPVLPGAVTPDQVQGLRFTFTRADGANWENPANPNQTVTFDVTRRDTLHTGGPVLPDTAGNPPAPGETAAGVATNTMTADVTSSDVDANGVPLTASDGDDATILYRHGANSVQVAKTPTGTTATPGAPLTYTLRSTNDGAVEITNPVITDELPTDVGGPQVTLATDPNFTYSIEPAGAAGMPTDPADVTVAATATTLTFTFPDGSAIPPGATYVIQFDVDLRPGLAADTQFTNTYGITGDRPWDACTGNLGLDVATGQCRGNAPNVVGTAGAIAIHKQVRAEGSDELGVIVDPTGFPVDCVADADGFYERPCVPTARPGGDVTWRYDIVNSGNLPINRILTIDSLPAIGDTLATATSLSRGSAWRPLLSGVRPTLVDPSFGTLNVWFTTGDSACDNAAGADGALLCPGLPWTQWPTGPLPVPPDTVTGLQFEIIPAAGTTFDPAAEIDVDVPMVAPAFDPNADVTAAQQQPDVIAYNSVGVAARYGTALGGPFSYTLVTEPPRVGAALANGQLGVEKLVTGDAAAFAPDTFEMTFACVSAGQVVPLPDDIATLTLTAGQVQTINNLPWGAECTLTEGDNGQTSTDTSSATATVERDDQVLAVATVTNEYDVGQFAIVKAVTGFDDLAYVGGPYPVTVDCTFLGTEVTGFPEDVDVTVGTPAVVDDVPVGSECTVTETDGHGATAITYDPPDADGNAGVVTVPSGDDPAVTLSITNDFPPGYVSLLKSVTGGVDPVFTAGPYPASLTCSFNGAILPGYPVVVALVPGTPSAAFEAPVNSVCTVTEVDGQGATTVTYDPPNADGTAGELVVPPGSTVATPIAVTIVNDFAVGGLRVNKAIGDNAADLALDDLVYTFRYQCSFDTGGGNLITSPDPAGFLVATVNAPAEVGGLPAGATCEVWEVGNQGGITDATADDPAVVVIQPGTILRPYTPVTVTNDYPTVAVRLVKLVAGGAHDEFVGGPYPILVRCWAADQIPGIGPQYPGFPVVTLVTPDVPVTAELPVGTTCWFQEQGIPDGVTATYDPATPSGDAGYTVVPAQQPSDGTIVGSVSVTNTYSTGSLVIQKTVSGPGVPTYSHGPFVFDVSCDDRGVADVYSTTRTIIGSADGSPVRSEAVTGLPIGATCTVTETDNGGATSPLPSPQTVTIVADAQSDVAFVTVDNRFAVGSIQLTKVVTGERAPANAGPFVVAVTCTAATSGQVVVWSGDVSLGGGAPLTATVVNVPTGARCTFAETADGGAIASTITPTSVIVGDGTTATVTVTNDFGSALPATGADIQRTIVFALLGIGVGSALVVVARRRRAHRRA